VQGLYDALLVTMKNGRTLGQSGRFTQLEPVIRRTFDIASMARLSVGSSWASLTEAQRQQVTESFGRYISAIYADRFDSCAGQKLQVTGEQPAAAGVMVRSQIVKANGEPVKIDYRRHQRGRDPPLRICRDPEEPGHRRPDRSAQPQGGHPDRDYGKGVVAALASFSRAAGCPTLLAAASALPGYGQYPYRLRKDLLRRWRAVPRNRFRNTRFLEEMCQFHDVSSSCWCRSIPSSGSSR
jgi:hypothetical protein